MTQNIIDYFVPIGRITADNHTSLQNDVKGSWRITFGEHKLTGMKLFSFTVVGEIKPLVFRKVAEKRMVCKKGSDVAGHDPAFDVGQMPIESAI
jgi:hypothetical protein